MDKKGRKHSIKTLLDAYATAHDFKQSATPINAYREYLFGLTDEGLEEETRQARKGRFALDFEGKTFPEKKYAIFRRAGFGSSTAMRQLMGPLTLEQVQRIEDEAETDEDIICFLTPCDIMGSNIEEESRAAGHWPLR